MITEHNHGKENKKKISFRRSCKKSVKDKVSEPVLSDDEEFRLKLGEPTIPKSSNMKPLSIAVEELYEGKVKIVNNANDISEDE